MGRGGKRGTFSGRGVKGQKARSGRKLRPEWRDILKSIPKRRGYKFKSGQPKPAVLSLVSLAAAFSGSELITPELLRQKGLVPRGGAVKVLGGARLAKKLNFKGVAFSAGAKDAIIKAGGSIN